MILKDWVNAQDFNPGQECEQSIEKSQGGHYEMTFKNVEKGGSESGTQLCCCQDQDNVIFLHQKSQQRICLDGGSKQDDSVKGGQPIKQLNKDETNHDEIPDDAPSSHVHSPLTLTGRVQAEFQSLGKVYGGEVRP